MTAYLINYILIILAYYSNSHRVSIRFRRIDSTDVAHARSKQVCIVAAINAIILSTFRDWSVGADTKSYEWTFRAAEWANWESVLQQFKDYFLHFSFSGDPSYYLLNNVFYTLIPNYQWWLLFIALVFTVPCAIFIYKYSSDALLSWVMYFALFFSFFGTTGLRQTLACSIVFFVGVPLIQKQRLVPFVLTVFIASSFHGSSLCILPMYWISKIKFNKIINIGYWICIVIAFPFRYQMLAVLHRVGGYEGYGQYATAGAPTFTVLLIAIGIVITIFRDRIIDEGNFIVNYSLHSVMIALVFSPLLMINPSLMRVVMYFSFFLVTLLPEFINIFKNNSRVPAKVIIIAMLMILSLRGAYYKFGEFLLFAGKI